MKTILSFLSVFFLILPAVLLAEQRIFFIDTLNSDTQDYSARIVSIDLNGEDVKVLHTSAVRVSFEDLEVDTAGERIYWSEIDASGNGEAIRSIKSMNYDGTDIQTVLTGIGVQTLTFNGDIAIDSANAKLYWVDSGQRLIFRSTLQGEDIETVSGFSNTSFVGGLATNPNGNVTVDPPIGDIFFTLSVLIPGGQRGVFYKGLDQSFPGEFVNRNGLQEQTRVLGAVVDGSARFIFWAESNDFNDPDNNTIQRATFPDIYPPSSNSDFSGPITIRSGLNQPYTLAIDRDSQQIYWIEQNSKGIFRSDYAGNSVTRLLETSEEFRPVALAVTASAPATLLTNATVLTEAPILKEEGTNTYTLTMKSFSGVEAASSKTPSLFYQIRFVHQVTQRVVDRLVDSSLVTFQPPALRGTYAVSYVALGLIKKKANKKRKKKLRKRIKKVKRVVKRKQKKGQDSAPAEVTLEQLQFKLRMLGFRTLVKTNASPLVQAGNSQE